ncbi:Rpn family recombination-promoting nuclease/putative transposase [Lentibacillus sp. Marseille-P4043]|uniref:Rpn family recombination-promoting nuclease/putative transposase n=1 Tax=Lentibacillus sp. Marseille-P4043 TaxID=2040293 RepID=UPI000D0B2091|nr:Rpn family recombination-promoting nuclease/putative transposase [Lentibacillus sp. Marseille-P4043]
MALTELHYENSTVYTASNVREDFPNYNKHKQEAKENTRTKLLKRVPLERLMDLKIDYAFKQLFGNERNKDITVVLLNAILQKTDRGRIKDVAFMNTESGREYVDDKLSRLDLLVITDAEERINVEIQFTDKYDMVKRSIYYWSRIYDNILKKNMDYKELRPVISINILNFDVFSQTERLHTTYHLYEDEDKYKLTDIMEFHFIEMTKLIRDWKDDKLDPWNDALARWLLMLGMVDHRNRKVYDDIFNELEEISMKDKSLRSAFQNWEELSMEEEQRLAYESRLKQVLDEEAYQRNKELFAQEKEMFAAEKNDFIEKKKKFTEKEEELTEEKKVFTQEKEIFIQKKKIFAQEKELITLEKELLNQERELLRQEREQPDRELDQEKKDFEQRKEGIEHKKRDLEQQKKSLTRLENIKNQQLDR